MAAVLDANIFIHALCSQERAAGNTLLARRASDCKALLRTLNEFYTSPVVEMELLPYMSDEEEKLIRLADALSLRVDSAVAIEAAAILRKAKKVPPRCEQCFVMNTNRKCSFCKATTNSKNNIMNDALLVAGAALTSDTIDTIYSYDSDIAELAQHCSYRVIRVVHPPNGAGPLFARTDDDQEADSVEESGAE